MPGETIAKSENYLFLANLLHNFRLEPGVSLESLPDPTIPVDGLAIGPQKFTCRATPL